MPSGRHRINAAIDGQAVDVPGALKCDTAASDTLTFRLP
jgi:hypothetical protein